MRTMQRASVGAAALALAAPLAFAASDGNYSPARQHCSGAANNSDTPDYAEPGCHNFALTVSDGGGHEYFGIGIPQTADGEQTIPGVSNPVFGVGTSTHQFAYWYDPSGAQDDCKYTVIDLKTGEHGEQRCPWSIPGAPNYAADVEPDPSSGLRLYFGADDNLAGGEHDSSESVDNGPSDGGAVVLNLNPSSVGKWIGYLQDQNIGKLLAHPLPLLDGGFGACADGLCVSLQTTRRDQTYPDGTPTYQPVADYSGHQWDPETCFGPSDDPTDDCGGMTIEQWNESNGDPAVEPGAQIYEDPDAQASPEGPYPLPALYVGTCGVIIGGGDFSAGDSTPQDGGPYVNSAGQLVIPTGCDQTEDDYNVFGPAN